MKSKILFASCLLLTMVWAIAACSRAGSTADSKPKFTKADLAKLRWIEGTWRGSGADQPAFFERYRFEDENTLAVDSFPDEKLDKVDDTTRFVLEDGEFANGGGRDGDGDGARWSASVIDAQGITFEPLAKAKNTFRWERESPDTWKAILKWPAVEGKPERERIYKMERIPGK
jgi:hypothetical protein